jgi:hypothetical protein
MAEEIIGPNCIFQPSLRDIPIEELKDLYESIKKREKLVGDILRERIYEFEKRKATEQKK